MKRALSLAIAVAVIAPVASAQFTLVGPDNAYADREGNSNFAFPWSVGSTSVARVQFFQDSSVFTNQGVTTPIRITRLRYRADAIANSWNGRSLPTVIDMSTCPVNYTAVTNTFASNHGADLTNVFNGIVTVVPGTGGAMPAAWYVDVALTTPFVYDPTTGGDLAIDFKITGASGTAGPVDHVGPGAVPPPLGSRVWDGNATAHTTATAQWVNQNYAPVCEFTYEPTTGLWPNFTATPTTGAAPLNVQFTDRSVTDDLTGILVWQWDLDGDSIVDSTQQNPSFTYNNCGSYNVTLTVIDGTHGLRTLTKNNFIVTDTVQPDFTWTTLPGNAVQFTDTSSPPATSWAWDFDGDAVTDSTQQNPAFVYGNGNTAYEVTLTASRLCGPASSKTHALAVAPNSIVTRLTGGTGTFGSTTGVLFDVQVTNPLGINIGAVTNCPYNDVQPSGPIQCQVYITDAAGGYAANHNNAAVWRLAATGTGLFEGGNAGSPVPVAMSLDHPIYLAPGSYGMAIYSVGCGWGYSAGAFSTSNADLAITTGGSKYGIFSATITNSRIWNGILHYGTQQTSEGAGFGYFAPGCAGTLGIAGQSFTGSPRLGSSLNVTVDRLPLSAMVYLIGFSRTTSSFGPLPFDMTAIGAPGCFGRVSLDAQLFSFGAGNTAAVSINVPANPNLAGLQAFTQPLVLDTGFNTLGVSMGDAWALLIAQ